MTPKFQQHTSLLQNDTEATLKFTLKISVATSKKSTLVNPQLNLSTLFYQWQQNPQLLYAAERLGFLASTIEIKIFGET